MPKVELRKDNQVATLTINNPPVNALSSDITAELMHYLKELAKDDEVRVLILTGAGDKAFVAGADIKGFPDLLQGRAGLVAEFAMESHKMYNALDNFPKPVIAAVNGLALGGGCELVLACDICIAADTAQFGLPEIKLGLFPGGGGTQRLPRLVGEKKAMELMYLGDPISAREAMQIGLANRVVPSQELVAETLKFGQKIASRPGAALNLIKQAVKRGGQVSLEGGLKIEADLFDRVFLTEDAKEGVQAFIEKRKASFKHR